MFHQKRGSSTTKSLKDLIKMIAVDQFLADSRRQILLQKMKELCALEPSRYESLCQLLIHNLVDYGQNLPETVNSYYAQPGGLVDLALNRTEAALSLLQEFMIQDETNAITEEQKLWQYALYSAAILRGIGKLYIDYRIDLFDNNGQLLQGWNPLFESLTNTGSYYDYELLKESDIEFRRRLNILLAKQLIPSSGFSWIASNSHVLAVWLALLNEDWGAAGTLGAILVRADAIAIQRYFTETLTKSNEGRSGRYRAGTFTGGIPLTTLDNDQKIINELAQELLNFLVNEKILINKAPLLTVPGGLPMSKEMFVLFVREDPIYKNWISNFRNQAIATGAKQLRAQRLNAAGQWQTMENEPTPPAPAPGIKRRA